MVTTTDSTSPFPDSAPEPMGVALSRTLTLRPSETAMTISSARTVSPEASTVARGNSARENSRPSARRTVISPSRSSRAWPGFRSASTMRRASRLKDDAVPVAASKTTTPTGEVSMRVSRSAWARRSSRWARALAMTNAAWAAKVARVSSSSRLNSPPSPVSP